MNIGAWILIIIVIDPTGFGTTETKITRIPEFKTEASCVIARDKIIDVRRGRWNAASLTAMCVASK